MKIILWGLVALYTFLLPDAIILYRDIVGYFGSSTAGKVPIIIVAIFGIAYVVYSLLSKKSWKNLLYVIPCAVIAFFIMRFVPNPNKHIHIPEYVLMAWLLYWVLSGDYKGKGIFILIFICGSMLGVVDELEQGIHPARFYGSSDMLVNCASVTIGVFTLMGLKKVIATDWEWTSYLKEFKGLLWLILYGFVGAVFMCFYLFRVQANEIFWGIYPVWLLGWNVLYLVMTPTMIFFYRGMLRKYHQIPEDEKGSILRQKVSTAQLWIFPLLVILFYMHALVVYVSISGVNFR